MSTEPLISSRRSKAAAQMVIIVGWLWCIIPPLKCFFFFFTSCVCIQVWLSNDYLEQYERQWWHQLYPDLPLFFCFTFLEISFYTTGRQIMKFQSPLSQRPFFWALIIALLAFGIVVRDQDRVNFWVICFFFGNAFWYLGSSVLVYRFNHDYEAFAVEWRKPNENPDDRAPQVV